MRRPATLLLVLLLASCASRSIPPGSSSAPKQRLRVWREEVMDNSNAVILWARNSGDQPVIVTDVRLYSCVNLFQDCTTVHPNVLVEPGATAQVLRLDPSNHATHPTFAWEYRWQGLSQATVVTRADVPGRTVARTSSTETVRSIPVDQFTPLVAADESNGRCTAAPPVNAPAGFQAYAMRFGGGPGQMARRVAVTLDASGRPLKYSDSRGDLRVPPPGIEPREPIVDPGPRTDITIDVVYGAVFLTNSPVGGPPERVMALGDRLLDARALDVPTHLIERMIRECGSP